VCKDFKRVPFLPHTEFVWATYSEGSACAARLAHPTASPLDYDFTDAGVDTSEYLIGWYLVTEHAKGRHCYLYSLLPNIAELQLTNMGQLLAGPNAGGPPNQNFGWAMDHPAHSATPFPNELVRSLVS